MWVWVAVLHPLVILVRVCAIVLAVMLALVGIALVTESIT